MEKPRNPQLWNHAVDLLKEDFQGCYVPVDQLPKQARQIYNQLLKKKKKKKVAKSN